MIELVLAAAFSRVAMALAPNIEPVMAFVIMASILGASPALVGFGAMALSDLVLGPGPWTLYTSTAYGLVGLIASFFKPKSRKQVVLLSGALTVIYDLLTNTAFGMSMGLPLVETLVAGVPFSILHILGNTVLCGLLLPQPIDLLKLTHSVVEEVSKAF